jgi:predicted transposase YdaD
MYAPRHDFLSTISTVTKFIIRVGIPTAGNAQRYTFEAVEVKETGFRLDGVFVPPDRTGIVYFCEVQFQRDEVLYERMKSR